MEVSGIVRPSMSAGDDGEVEGWALARPVPTSLQGRGRLAAVKARED